VCGTLALEGGPIFQDVLYILPLSTVILDDNFFSHRELLVGVI
jgi:hypothetical protein